MGPEIIVISVFRNNRGQKSADLVISEPRNNSSSNLSELRLFFTFGYYLVPSITCHHCLLCTWYGFYLLYTSPITHNKESQAHIRQHVALVCEKELRPHTQTRQLQPPPPPKPPQQQHSSTTTAAQQQRQQQRRW